ncbi:MAG: hypothetical protein MK110_00400 [Fuerstiella sp.]|nr:hypothetical protein [Fuerstiella sp.]
MRTIDSPRSLAFVMMTLLSGCMTGPSLIEQTDPYSSAKPGSDRWWSEKAQITPGVRQKCSKGKIWPVRPRPSGEGQQFSHTFHAAHYWPLPYVCADRQYVENIMEVQKINGWIEENTLYNRHFDSADQTLTRPGRLYLLKILEVTPLQRRVVYVQSARDPGIDSERLINVESALAELTNGSEKITVSVRSGREYSRPASEVQIINELYNNSIPAPRLGGAAASSGVSVGAGSGAPASVTR